MRHGTCAKATDATSAQTSHPTTAKAADVSSPKPAHVAAAESTTAVSSAATAAAGLRPRRDKAAGKQGAR
jgi:hypothetical protein